MVSNVNSRVSTRLITADRKNRRRLGLGCIGATAIVVVMMMIMMLVFVSFAAPSSSSTTTREPRAGSDGEKDFCGGEYESSASNTSGRLHAQQLYYNLIGVSGTLEDGFPLRPSLDYRGSGNSGRVNGSSADHSTTEEEHVPAIRIGRALVRGYKAYLDVKDPGWREYVGCGDDKNMHCSIGGGGGAAAAAAAANAHECCGAPPPPAIPNAVVMATGCHEHANRYWVYAVDTRQVHSILAGEPRFLGIAPDTGLVDLRSNETDDRVRRIASRLIAARNTNGDNNSTAATVVAIPLVTGVWFHPSYVESPPYKVMMDGTQITSYPESLALWAGVDHYKDLLHDRRGVINRDDASAQKQGATSTEAAWDRVFRAIRQAEAAGRHLRQMDEEEKKDDSLATTHPAALECRRRVRMGVGPSHVRLNFPLTVDDLV
jgi:hypothetical protein